MRRCQGGVHVAVDHDPGRAIGHELVLEGRQQCSGLVSLAARADTQADIGRRQVEVPEEDVGQQRVVVLAGMDDPLGDAKRAQRADDGRRLDEVRPRAHDMHDDTGRTGRRNGGPGRADRRDRAAMPTVPATPLTRPPVAGTAPGTARRCGASCGARRTHAPAARPIASRRSGSTSSGSSTSARSRGSPGVNDTPVSPSMIISIKASRRLMTTTRSMAIASYGLSGVTSRATPTSCRGTTNASMSE